MTPTQEKIYSVLKAQLGQHLTLDPTVPAEVGCCECATKILSLSGVCTPKKGIAYTLTLLNWLQNNPDFEEIYAPEEAALIISATSTGNGTVEGHVGFCGAFGAMYPKDWGICSNNSATGLLGEQWSYQSWLANYEVKGGMKTHLFRAL